MLSETHRRFLIVEQCAIPFAINVVLNGVIAFLLFRSAEAIPLWGESSAGIDLIVTALVLPFLSCLIVSRIIVGQVRNGKVPPLPPQQIPQSGWSHRSPSARGLLLGTMAILLSAVPLVAALSLADTASFEPAGFIGFKAGWAGLLAATSTPIIGWWALAHASRELEPPARSAEATR